MILALDLGTQTGWAIGGAVQPTLSGTQSFHNDRYSGGGMRFLRFRRFLTELAASVEITEVWFEEVRNHKGVDAAHVYGGLLATLQTWCEESGLPYSGQPVGAIKKYATGKGNAGKDAVKAAMAARGFKFADDNEADALALLCLVLETEVRG